MSLFHTPATPYSLENVEQGDLILIGFPGGTQFNAIVTAEPSDFRAEVIDTHGVRMEVPSTLILDHTPRGHWQAARTVMAA